MEYRRRHHDTAFCVHRRIAAGDGWPSGGTGTDALWPVVVEDVVVVVDLLFTLIRPPSLWTAGRERVGMCSAVPSLLPGGRTEAALFK